ncbi:unnamed protein product, partial [Mesorhabditis spiculigera]
MAKSLRSKFKRKMRSIARVKKEPKVLKKLDETLATTTKDELNAELNARKEAQMETDAAATAPATINLKTMKKADGSYPVWLSARKIKKAKHGAKKAAQPKKKKKGGKR